MGRERYTASQETGIREAVPQTNPTQKKELMKAQLILARANGYGCAALFVNQVVVAEANSTPEIDRLIDKAARQLSCALGVPLVECLVEVPDEMDGIWQWPDLLDKLPPVQVQLAKHELLVYCWNEGGVHPATQDGPGDAWDELCFDTQSPVAGTPYLLMAPIHETGFGVLDEAVHAKVLEDFEAWLDDRQTHDVSAIFHETVAKAASLIRLKPAQQDPVTLVEQVTMSVLGHRADPSPGINWQCARQWRVNDVRAAVRGALEAARVIPLADCSAQAHVDAELEI